MTIALVIFFVAATGWFAIHALRPFARSPDEQARDDVLGEELRLLDELTIEKEQQLAALRELASDRATQKISEEDYAAMKRRHERRAVELMRSIDELHGGRDWHERLDRALAKAPPAPEEAAASEPIKALPPEAGHRAQGTACASCAHALGPDDRFCARCGSARTPAARAGEPDARLSSKTATA